MLFQLSLVALIAFVGSVGCSIQGRVVNGIDSDIKKYPFMVSLRNGMGRHFCGGTIVAERFILTAAHCVNEKLASELSIQYGTTVRSADGKNVINIKNIITHKKYNKLTLTDDIALLELEKPIVQELKTVKLPDPFFEVSQDQNGAPGVLLGWGSKSESGYAESHLQEVELKIYSNKECKKRKKPFANTKRFCAGVDEGRKGICYGDSGGPLLSEDFVQLGIVSMGDKICGGSPGIYTKVSHYGEWIAKHINPAGNLCKLC